MRPSGIPSIPPSVRHPIHAVPEHHHAFSKEASQDNLILPAHIRSSDDSVENSPHTILPQQQHPQTLPHPSSIPSIPPSLKFPSQVRNEGGNIDRNIENNSNESNQIESGDISPPNSLQSIHSETGSPTKKLVTSDYFPYEEHHNHIETISPLKDHTLHHPHAHRDKNVFSSTLLQSPKGSGSNIFYNNPNISGGGGGVGGGGGKSPVGYARNRGNITARNRFPNVFPSVSSSLVRGISGGGNGGSIIFRQPSPGLFHMGSHLSSGEGGGLSMGMGSTEDLPSVLLSLLKQQNVDYHNDYYWLEKFHRNKILSKNDFEKSLAEFHQFQQSQLLHPSSHTSQLSQQQQQQHQHISSSSATTSLLLPFALQPLQLQRQTSNNSNPDSIPNMNMNSGSGSGEKPPFPNYGVYATNINRNKISSPKPFARKSYSHENAPSSALKSGSHNHLPVISTSGDALYSLPHSSSLVPGGISSSSLPSHDLLINKTNSTSNPLFSTGILQDPSGHYFPFASSSDENDKKSLEAESKELGGDDNDYDATNEKAILLTKFNTASDKK
jgi:hypothetical protein